MRVKAGNVLTGDRDVIVIDGATVVDDGPGRDIRLTIAPVTPDGVVISLKGSGAVGDGVADDSAVITAVMAVAASGNVLVYAEAGTYLTGAFTVPAGVTVRGPRNAIFKAKNGANTTLVTLAADARLDGVTVDGNRANQASNGIGVSLAGDRAVITDCSVIHCFSYGIQSANFNNVRVRNCDVSDTRFQGIFIEANNVSITRPHVTGCTVDRSAEVGVVAGTGITIKGTPTYKVTGARISGCDVTMPNGGGQGAICIETFGGCQRARVTENNTYGGSMGISCSSDDKTTVTGNTVFSPDDNGIELASALNCVVTGNTVDGNGVTTNGIVASNTTPTRHAIAGNHISGCLTRAMQISSSNYTAITGNTILMAAANTAVEIIGSTHFTFSGNTLYGAGTATKGLMLNGSSLCAVSGNTFHNFTQHGVLLFATSGTIDYVTVSGCEFVSCGTPVGSQLSGGAVLGNQVSVIGCPGWSAVGMVNVLDMWNAVLDGSSTGTPEGAIGAGIGSTWRNLAGGAATTLYVKTSGTGNTGWTAK